MITRVPATADAVRKIYRGDPARSIRGFIFEEDGKPVGLAGMYLDPAGAAVMFFDGDHAAAGKNLKEVVLAGRELLALAQRSGLPVVSNADENIKGSERLLEFLGFKPHLGRVYRWHG